MSNWQIDRPGLTFPHQPSILTADMTCAEVAEQADAHDSKSCGVTRVGSTPTFGTHKMQMYVHRHLIRRMIYNTIMRLVMQKFLGLHSSLASIYFQRFLCTDLSWISTFGLINIRIDQHSERL